MVGTANSDGRFGAHRPPLLGSAITAEVDTPQTSQGVRESGPKVLHTVPVLRSESAGPDGITRPRTNVCIRSPRLWLGFLLAAGVVWASG